MNFFFYCIKSKVLSFDKNNHVQLGHDHNKRWELHRHWEGCFLYKGSGVEPRSIYSTSVRPTRGSHSSCTKSLPTEWFNHWAFIHRAFIHWVFIHWAFIHWAFIYRVLKTLGINQMSDLTIEHSPIENSPIWCSPMECLKHRVLTKWVI